MDTNQIFLNAGLAVDPTELNKWIAIRDMSPKFYSSFKTDRLGKIQKGRFYVTLRSVDTQARGLMTDFGFEIAELGTTSSKGDASYPGFSLGQCTPETLASFVEGLQAAVTASMSYPKIT